MENRQQNDSDHQRSLDKAKEMLEQSFWKMLSPGCPVKKVSVELQRHGNKVTGPYLTKTEQ